MTKKYILKPSGREEEPQKTPRHLAHISAARLMGAEKELRILEQDLEMLNRPMLERIAVGGELIKALREALLRSLMELPAGERKIRRGARLYFVQTAAEAIEVLDETLAVEELEALGPKGAVCVKVKKSVSKKEAKELIKRGDAPAFEHIKLQPPRAVLAERETP